MDWPKVSPVPATLSFVITTGYFGILIGSMAGWLHIDDSQSMLMMLGSLTTAWGVAMSYWFNTTRDSGRKTELLARAESIKNDPPGETPSGT